MSDINTCTVVGRLGAAPEVRYTAGGEPVVNVRLAASEKWRDKASGEQREETLWIDAVIWGRIAEVVGEHVAKGERLGVTGRLVLRKFTDKQGNERSVIELRARDVMLMGAKGGAESNAPGTTTKSDYERQSGGGNRAPRQQPAPANADEDIPF